MPLIFAGGSHHQPRGNSRAIPKQPRGADDDSWGTNGRRVTRALTASIEDILARVVEQLSPLAFAHAMDARGGLGFIELDMVVASSVTAVIDDLYARLALAFHDGQRETRAKAIEAALVRKEMSSPGEQLDTTFALENPRAQAYALTATGNLITRISDDTKAQVRRLVGRGWGRSGPDGWNRTIGGMKRDIRDLLSRSRVLEAGLTMQGERAIETMREKLLDDGWSDEDIRERLARYAATLRLQRAEVIARTEVNDSLNAGQAVAWEQAKLDGLIPAQSVRVWIASDNARTCPTCGVLDGLKASLDGAFLHPDGRRFFRPPAHPNCRCTVGLETDVGTAPGLFG